MAAETLTCSTCKLPAAKGSMRGKQWVCSQCVSLQSMLAYNLGSEVVKSLDDKLTFFRQARQTAGDGRFTWTVVRACVRESMVCRRLSESEVDVSGKYLPMAVHLKDGWTEQQVMAKQDSMEDPELGTLWRIPVMGKSMKVIHQEVDEELTQRETDATKNRGKKRKAAEAEGPAEEEDWNLPLPGVNKVGAPKAQPKPKSSASSAEAKERRQLMALNKAKHSLAAKSVGGLCRLLKQLEGACNSKHCSTLPEVEANTLRGAAQRTSQYKKAAVDVLSAYESQGLEKGPLPLLPFNAAEVACVQKAATEVLATYRERVKAEQEKKKAEAPPKPAEKAEAKAKRARGKQPPTAAAED